MKNSKRKLIVALNEAYEDGVVRGKYQSILLYIEESKTEEEVEAMLLEDKRNHIERLADWWDIYLSDDEDLL
tara:strand:+ start:379 stop:594 length:216 start_codon:yes stop_codon:yes gene_type:complete